MATKAVKKIYREVPHIGGHLKNINLAHFCCDYCPPLILQGLMLTSITKGGKQMLIPLVKINDVLVAMKQLRILEGNIVIFELQACRPLHNKT
jgi:hypothetical protein